MASPARSLTLGFIAVQRMNPETFRAGYLLSTDYGRPVEFHYTTSVVVPRTQQILYGPDFEPIFFSEILAKPMTDRQSMPPQLIAVSSPSLLRLRSLIPAPVVCIRSAEGEAGLSVECSIDHPKDEAMFDKVAGLVPPGFDWLEPFDRVVAALAEIKDAPGSIIAA